MFFSGLIVLSAIVCSRLFHVPLVMSYHTHLPIYVESYLPRLSWVLFRILWWWIKWTHSFADLTLVTSTQMQEEFQVHSIPRVDVWQKGVDAERFSPRHFHENMRRKMMGANKSADDRLVLLYVGRLAVEKRILKIKEILSQVPNASLCLVGTGPQEEFLKQEFKNTPTVFLGELHGDELSQAYASADIFCFPSDSETLGFVVMEAMASGLAVVAANAGGIPSIIEDGQTGYLVSETSEYVDRINGLRTNAAKRKRIASSALLASQAWSWDTAMNRLVTEQYPKAKANFQSRWGVRLWRKLFGKKEGISVAC